MVFKNGNISVKFKFAGEFHRIAEYIEVYIRPPWLTSMPFHIASFPNIYDSYFPYYKKAPENYFSDAL